MLASDFRKFGRDGVRFMFRCLGDQFQVYGGDLRHVCICETREIAEMVTESLCMASEMEDAK